MRKLLLFGVSLVTSASLLFGCAPAPAEEEVDVLESALGAQDFDTTVQQLTALPYLPWAYTPDGCYARATYYSMLLASKGVPTNHLYVVAQPYTTLGGMWGWHVAPLVTKDGDPNHLYVLDPVFDQTKALTSLEWVAHQDHDNPSLATYPILHVHPGNSYLRQYAIQHKVVGVSSPVAADYKEPSFAEMPKFSMFVVNEACDRMHLYIDFEPGTTDDQKEAKHKLLGSETQRIVTALVSRDKIEGDPTLSTTCTRSGDDSADGGSAGGTTNGEDFVEPNRIQQ